MKKTILFMACCALIACSSSKEPEKAQRSRNSLSDRIDMISQAREVQQKENEAVDSRNKLINDIFNKNQGRTPAEQ